MKNRKDIKAITFSTAFTKDTVRKLDKLATKANRPRSYYVRKAVDQYMAREGIL